MHAHGRPPYIERVAFDPNDPERLVLQFSFGLVISDDAGASWTWVCGAAYNADSTWEDPDIVITEDGSTIVGTFTTANLGAPDLCTFERPSGSIHDTAVIDLAQSASDADLVWAVTSRGGAERDRLQRTEDGGRTWVELDTVFDVLLESLALAPSDPARLYVSGFLPATDLRPRRALILRSNDGGASFTELDIDLLEGERTARIVGVDPTDADRLFVRMPRGALDPAPERLLYSDDGGDSFTMVHAMKEMRGFAISDDGQTVWIGSGGSDGVWVAREGSLTFTQVNDLSVRCLAARGDALWLCVDQIQSEFAFGRSLDGGETVEPLLRLDEVEALPTCPTCSTTGLTCPFWIDDLKMDFAMYLGTEPPEPMQVTIPPECVEEPVLPDAGAGGLDGGVSGPDGGVSPPGSGCGCRAPSSGSSPWPAVLVLGVLALLLGRRRR